MSYDELLDMPINELYNILEIQTEYYKKREQEEKRLKKDIDGGGKSWLPTNMPPSAVI